MINWFKTMQARDKVQCITLPKLMNVVICPYTAVKQLRELYPFTSSTFLLQKSTQHGLIPLTDHKVRKVLKGISLALGLQSSYFTFHAPRR